jgi:hypothetical protein
MSVPWVVAFVSLWVLVILTAVVVVGVLRRISGVLEQAEARLRSSDSGFALGGIPVASRVPEFRVFQGNGSNGGSHEVMWADLIDAPTILLFMDQDCEPCRQVANEVDAAIDELKGVRFLVVLNEEAGRPQWLPTRVPVVYERRQEVSQAFENTATPQAYLLDPSRLVLAKRVIGSLSDLRELARESEPAMRR